MGEWFLSVRSLFSNYAHLSGTKSSSGSVIIWAVIVLLGCVDLSVADRTFTKVYEPILGTSACFKRLNGTHEIGCRSSSNGDTGVLHFIEDQQSLQWVLKDGPHSPYIALMYPEFFKRDNLIQFRNSGRVNGVLLLSGKDPASSNTTFSPDLSCPNEDFSIYVNSSRTCSKWNEPGNGLLFENFQFPIFYVTNETAVEELLKCYNTYNRPVDKKTPRDWPLCAGQLKAFMLAAVDTQTCRRRSGGLNLVKGASTVCDPLGDKNVWGTLYSQNRTENESQSAIVIAARMDGASIFDELSPSADTSVTGLVTLISVIKHLAAVKDQLVLSSSSAIDNIYFMLFNGESFGYIGSSRIVYDMLHGAFPLKLDEIKYYLEINQANLPRENDSYYIHQSDGFQGQELTEALLEQAQLQNVQMKTAKQSWGLPPSSLHSFLRERPNITGLVVTNHEQTYKNQYYNSIYDTKDRVRYNYKDPSVFSIQQKLADLSATLANTLISLLQIEGDAPKIKPDVEAIDELLHCYLETRSCSLFSELLGQSSASVDPNSTALPPYPLYVGVSRSTNHVTMMTKSLLITYFGTVLKENVTDEDDCWNMDTPGPRYLIGKTCWECPTVNSTDALSPAFLIDGDYDWSSKRYSTWTESIWQPFSVRIFLKPSLLHELLVLCSGILVFIVSMVLVRYLNQRKDVIFTPRDVDYDESPSLRHILSPPISNGS